MLRTGNYLYKNNKKNYFSLSEIFLSIGKNISVRKKSHPPLTFLCKNQCALNFENRILIFLFGKKSLRFRFYGTIIKNRQKTHNKRKNT